MIVATLCGLLAVGLILIARSDRPALSPVLVGAVASVPALLLILTLLNAGPRFGDLRLQLKALRFDRAAQSGAPVRVGGSVANDDLVIERVPEGLLRLNGTEVAIARHIPTGTIPAVISTGSGRSVFFPAAILLHAGDQFCLSACTSAGAIWFTVRPGEAGLTRSDGVATRAFQQRGIIFPGSVTGGLLYWGANQAIYPVRDYGAPLNATFEGGTDPCAARRQFCLAGNDPALSYLYYAGGLGIFGGGGNQLFLMPLDPDMRIRTGTGLPGVPPAEWRGHVGTEQPLDLSIWEVNYASPDVDLDEVERASSLRLRRTASRALSSEGELRLTLKVPPTRTVSREDLKNTARTSIDKAPTGPVVIDVSGAASVDAASDRNLLSFGIFGGAGGRAAAGRIVVNDFERPGATLAVDDGSRAKPTNIGQPFSLGQAGGEAGTRLADFALSESRLPWLVELTALGWAMLLFLVQWRIWTVSPSALVITIVTQLLLAFRLLVAVEANLLDPSRKLAQALGGGLIAYVALPLLLAALPRRPSEGRHDLVPAILFLVGLVVAVRVAGMTSDTGPTIVAAAAVLVAVARWFGLPRPRADTDPQGPAADSPADPASPASWQQALLAPFRTWWGLTLLAIPVGRIGLMFGGMKERFVYPPIALSVVHVPLLMIGFAGLFVALRRARSSREAIGILAAYWVLAALVLVLPPLAVRDNGFVLFALPILFFGLAIHVPHLSRWWRLPLIVPALVVPIAIVIAPAIFQWVFSYDWRDEIARAVPQTENGVTPLGAMDEAAAAKALGHITERNQVVLRAATVFYPEMVSRAGTEQAEQLRRWSSQLRDYSSSFGGQGFGMPSDIADLRPVQVDDNVTAIHLLYPYGRLGTAALLAVLALAAWSARRRSLAPEGWPRGAAELALWTWFVLGTYMVLANLQLLPFTGRNFYLLAAYSNSDLLEASVLAALAMLGLAQGKADEAKA